GSQRLQGYAGPTLQSACGDRLKPRGAAASGRQMRIHTLQRAQAQRRVEIRRFQSLPPRAKGAVARSVRRQWQMSGRRRPEVVPATWGPNRKIRGARDWNCWPEGVRYRTRYIPRDPAARKFRSIRGESVSAQAVRRRKL